ncbi:M3 family metallopeptidase [Lentimicrobium sp.]|uniref:M3 family metallopeptidase n=1 Tax=Lentimicrobium sp. TaxID=2034841 RepID=UPI002D1360BE|nr:M3 family metallopeptidase [Lentimicrobium sp.]HPR24774.1 M3 family metallopeptidase [Lentimicrobium sp.]HRW68548.1 M3 family metallopeptidase [Lentimicrobium sp.]
MKNYLLPLLTMAILSITGCQQKQTATEPENPFFSEYTTPFQVPPFDKIDTSHYLPAFIEGIRQQAEEIAAITGNLDEPDFENTILAYDKSGKLLTRVSYVFYNLSGAHTNDQMQEIARKISPLMSKHQDDISMNPELFSRIRKVYEKRHESGLDDQQIRVVEKYYRDFERQGANLPAGQQKTLRKINEELAMLQVRFGENQLAEINKNFKLVIEKQEDLAGLPEGVIAAAAEAAKSTGDEGKWVFTLAKPSLIPFLQYADNRSLREKLYRGYFMRGNNDNASDNKQIVKDIVRLRAEKARLLGFDNFAAYVIDENMAKTTGNVDKFLSDLFRSALPVAKSDLAEMQKIAAAEGNSFKLESWDWWYYAEKLRKQKYDLDETQIKPYLKLENVRDGMFEVANKLYGITFTKLTNLPVYQKDVETFEVKEADGSHLGILYLDYFPRAEKSGGAWCTGFQSAGWENGKKVDPIVSIVCNFTPPSGNVPALLSWDETTTLFHEFGHALHGLFTEGRYTRTAGNVARDFVELPSQIMENWAGEPEVLRMYARHYETGEIIPDNLIEKLTNSSHFNQGFTTVEYIAASILDLDYHKLGTPAIIDDINAFEKEAMDRIGLIPEILPRYRTTYFSHIFDGGYAAGYYVYLWAAVLDSDAFDYFRQSGDIFNKELAAAFRKHCLAENGNDEGMEQYRKFRGQDPSQEPLLKKRGLK